MFYLKSQFIFFVDHSSSLPPRRSDPVHLPKKGRSFPLCLPHQVSLFFFARHTVKRILLCFSFKRVSSNLLSLPTKIHNSKQADKFAKIIFQLKEQYTTAPQENTARFLSFEWSHFRISSTDSKVISTFSTA